MDDGPWTKEGRQKVEGEKEVKTSLSHQVKLKLEGLLEYLQTSETIYLLFFSILVGLVAGFGAIVFRWLIAIFKDLYFTRGEELLSFLGPYYVIIIPALGGLVVGPLIYFFAREAKGHGVPEVMEAVAVKGGRIRPRVAVIKSLASSICIGSGGSAGREGPIVQIGSAFGSTLGQLLKLSPGKIKGLVACGAAGGISATFNTPLAGVFFSLEVILGKYSPKLFTPIVISSVAACVVSRRFLGNYPSFVTPPYSTVSAWEFLFYVGLGFLCAGIALLFIKTLYKCEDIFDVLRFPEYLKPVIGGLMIGSIGLYFPQVFGVGYETIELALYGKIALLTLIFLVLVKIIATSLTLGSGGSGGIFAPSLFMGATLGGFFGKAMHHLFPKIVSPPGAYALVGMGGVFAGAARAPITAILILFEMTDDYKIILPLMVTCVISALIINYFTKESIYTLKLLRRGIDLKEAREEEITQRVKVSQALVKKIYTVPEDMPVGEVGLLIKSTKRRGFPVLNEQKNLVGIITHQDIKKAMAEGRGDLPVKDITTRDILFCYPQETLDSAFKKMGEEDIGHLPVVEENNPQHLVGLVTRKSLILAYDHALEEEESGE